MALKIALFYDFVELCTRVTDIHMYVRYVAHPQRMLCYNHLVNISWCCSYNRSLLENIWSHAHHYYAAVCSGYEASSDVWSCQ